MSNFMIADVEPFKKRYPPIDDPEVARRFLTVGEYLNLARRIIAKFAPANSRVSMLASEDAIDFVAHRLMLGDWGYRPDKAALNTYRGYCGRCAIQRYLKNMARQRFVTVPEDDGSVTKVTVINDSIDKHDPKAETPVDTVIKTETSEKVITRLKNRLHPLTHKQQLCVLKRVVDGMTMADIGRELGMTTEGVRQSILNGVKKLNEG